MISLVALFASCSSDSSDSGSSEDGCTCFRNTYVFDEYIGGVLIGDDCSRDGELLVLDEKNKTIIECE